MDSTSFLKTEVPPLGMVNSDSHGSQEGKVKEDKQWRAAATQSQPVATRQELGLQFPEFSIFQKK